MANLFETTQVPEDFKPAVQQAINMFDWDRQTGAPMNVRAAISGSKTPEDQLSTLKNFYPDAMMAGEELVFRNPETNRYTNVNPTGFELGDVVESGGGISEFVGGGLGAVTGSAVVPGPGSVVGAGLGAAGGRELWDSTMQAVFGSEDSRTLLDRTGEFAITAGLNMIGQKGGELLSGAMAKIFNKGAILASKPATEVAESFGEMGVKPTVSMVSGSKTLQNLEQALSKMPVSSDVYDATYQKILNDMDDYAKATINSLSKREGAEATGISIKRGVDQFVKDFTDKGKVLYDKLDTFIKPGDRIQTPSFNTMLEDSVNKFRGDPEFADILTSDTFKSLLAASKASASRGGMEYRTWKALRKKLADEFKGSSGLLDDVNKAELKQLYGAISDDIGVVAKGIGDDAFRSYNQANNFWRAGRARIDNVLEPITTKRDAESIFRAVQTSIKAGPTTIRALRKSMPKEEFNQVRAEVIRKMGLANPGAQSASGDVFSPNTFLTNWNKIDPAAKTELFSSDAQLRRALDNLATASGSIKSLGLQANTSNTAAQGVYMGTLLGALGGGGLGYSQDDTDGALSGAVTGAVTGAAIMAGKGVALSQLSKLMTNSRFVTWLTDSAAINMGNPKAISAHLGRLMIIADKNPSIKQEVRQYLNELKRFGTDDNTEQQ